MTHAKRWAVLWTLLILVLCWTPHQDLPITEDGPSLFQRLQFDKLIHCALFAGFSFLWIRAFPKRSFLIIATIGALLSVLTELGQATSFVNRDANIWDGLADLVGVFVGLKLALMLPARSIEPTQILP